MLFFFAGHGLQGREGHYYLTPNGFNPADLNGTGLAWSRLADIVAPSKARVIFILDACHSGATAVDGIATNDQAASALLNGSKAPILVIAASKGRQFSYEDLRGGGPLKWGGGGAFTYALARVLGDSWHEYDSDRNGALEVSEIYRAVKQLVVTSTRSAQTPWLVRQDLIGDFSIF